MVPKAKRFFEHLVRNRTKILFPAICWGEFLIKVPEDRYQTLEELARKFLIIAPFDLRAVTIYSRLSRENKAIMDAIRAEPDKPRVGVKFDAMVVATALANNVSCIYSEDRHLSILANGRVQVSPIPDVHLETDQLSFLGG
jgi:hypothetical protein